ncbi:LysR family transcriptional regulator [Lactobacillus sp. DCY120]|uniref:LysR family transcriptional regulator n=1 Tax=Bombilactobacillus apium TaxID=2675299 RepID=A0A850QWG7_9LACO|nr:LysR family transcriptional regulator [Bombilactobacillus apium]NVY96144.1 LysR family transcriptional regulator [Bombilactobacillus apium]
MRLLQLQYFLDVAATQNISQSARNLHLTQPSLSRSIHELEQELGISLFTRNGRSLKINAAGSQLAQVVQTSLTTLQQGINELQQTKQEQAQIVTLRLESSTTLIPGLLTYLQQVVPQVTIHLVQHGPETNQLLPYDWEFSTQARKGQENQLLLEEEIYFAFSTEKLAVTLADKKSLTAAELVQFPLIATEPNPLRDLVLHTLRTQQGALQPEFTTGDRATILGMVRAGVGYCYLPSLSWPDLDLQGIKLYSLTPQPLTRKIYLSRPLTTIPTAQTQAVAQGIHQYFAQLQK